MYFAIITFFHILQVLFFIKVYMVVFLFNIVIYVFLLLFVRVCILIVCLCIFIVPAGTLRLPWLRFFRALSSVVRQMPGYNSQRRGTARTLPKLIVLLYVLFVLCRSVYCFCLNVYCTAETRWLPKCSEQIYHIISYHIISYHIILSSRYNSFFEFMRSGVESSAWNNPHDFA